MPRLLARPSLRGPQKNIIHRGQPIPPRKPLTSLGNILLPQVTVQTIGLHQFAMRLHRIDERREGIHHAPVEQKVPRPRRILYLHRATPPRPPKTKQEQTKHDQRHPHPAHTRPRTPKCPEPESQPQPAPPQPQQHRHHHAHHQQAPDHRVALPDRLHDRPEIIVHKTEDVRVELIVELLEIPQRERCDDHPKSRKQPKGPPTHNHRHLLPTERTAQATEQQGWNDDHGGHPHVEPESRKEHLQIIREAHLLRKARHIAPDQDGSRRKEQEHHPQPQPQIHAKLPRERHPAASRWCRPPAS